MDRQLHGGDEGHNEVSSGGIRQTKQLCSLTGITVLTPVAQPTAAGHQQTENMQPDSYRCPSQPDRLQPDRLQPDSLQQANAGNSFSKQNPDDCWI
ncbi:hypothetical protein EYF80_008819 [Liparis tanakae]|uniref:Uncharacterized protein n=1 Tax=Liparis tanakae TaxID=230148 RepID=A0A4Z2ITG5_9TELE|nr:hypothetical protein EYF80_008819 [Liparis tanakae]